MYGFHTLLCLISGLILSDAIYATVVWAPSRGWREVTGRTFPPKTQIFTHLTHSRRCRRRPRGVRWGQHASRLCDHRRTLSLDRCAASKAVLHLPGQFADQGGQLWRPRTVASQMDLAQSPEAEAWLCFVLGPQCANRLDGPAHLLCARASMRGRERQGREEDLWANSKPAAAGVFLCARNSAEIDSAA